MVVPDKHLPGWLQSAMLAPNPVRVTFPESGYVVLDPLRERYDSDIEDWASVPALNGEAVQMAPLTQAMAEPCGLPLSRLKWAVTLGCLHGQPLDNYQFKYNLIRLASWPCLTHLPEPVIPQVARICALLARKPTIASLIPLTLGLSEEQVFPVIEALRLNNHLQIAEFGNSAPAPLESTSQHGSLRSDEEGRQTENSLIGKIWQRLGMGA